MPLDIVLIFVMIAHMSCDCFPTGLAYPGIAAQLALIPEAIGLAPEFDKNTPLSAMKFVVIDVETTGFSYSTGDRIVEIALVFFDGPTEVGQYSFLINPKRSIPARVTEIHGITDERVRNEPHFAAVAERIYELMRGRVPVAHNAPFDRGFVYNEMRAAGVHPSMIRSLPPALRANVAWIDTIILARGLTPGPANLGAVAARCGLPLHGAHQAAADATVTGHILFSLLKSETTYFDLINKQRELAAGGAAKPGRRKK